MSEKIVVPTLGESVTEATVAKWLKNKGDKVSSDEPIVELETDKVNVEVPSPSNGILENISAKEGETVNVGALLGLISQSKSVTASPKSKTNEKKYSPPKLEKIEPETVKKSEQVKMNKKKSSSPLILEEDSGPKVFDESPLVLEEEPLVLDTAHTENKEKTNDDLRITPSARKMISEKKIDIQSI